jgi:hypothetical protein
MQNTIQTRAQQADTEHTSVPHGCISGWIYIGHLVVEDDGEEVEVVEAIRCRRCQINEYLNRI